MTPLLLAATLSPPFIPNPTEFPTDRLFEDAAADENNLDDCSDLTACGRGPDTSALAQYAEDSKTIAAEENFMVVLNDYNATTL